MRRQASMAGDLLRRSVGRCRCRTPPEGEVEKRAHAKRSHNDSILRHDGRTDTGDRLGDPVDPSVHWLAAPPHAAVCALRLRREPSREPAAQPAADSTSDGRRSRQRARLRDGRRCDIPLPSTATHRQPARRQSHHKGSRSQSSCAIPHTEVSSLVTVAGSSGGHCGDVHRAALGRILISISKNFP